MSLKKTIYKATVRLGVTVTMKQKLIEYKKTSVLMCGCHFIHFTPALLCSDSRVSITNSWHFRGRSRSYIDAKRLNTAQFSQSAALKQMQNIIDIPTLLPALPSDRDWSVERWIRCKWGPNIQRSHIQPAILPLRGLRKPVLTRMLKRRKKCVERNCTETSNITDNMFILKCL